MTLPHANHGTPWSPEHTALVRDSYATLGPSAIAARIGRTTKAVVNKALSLGMTGLHRPGHRPRAKAVAGPGVPRARAERLDLSDPAVRAAVSARIAALSDARARAEAARDAVRPWEVPGVEVSRRSWNGHSMARR